MAERVLVHNRKAGFDIEVEEKLEAGLVLTGEEIKSIRAGRAQLSGSYVKLMQGRRGSNELPQVVVIGLHLSAASEADRTRSLLLHRREIEQLVKALSTKGKIAVPLSLYLRHGWAKLSIGIGVGRKQYDKRELLKKREGQRTQERELKRLGKA